MTDRLKDAAKAVCEEAQVSIGSADHLIVRRELVGKLRAALAESEAEGRVRLYGNERDYAGQESMRERAAIKAVDFGCEHCCRIVAAKIRALGVS